MFTFRTFKEVKRCQLTHLIPDQKLQFVEEQQRLWILWRLKMAKQLLKQLMRGNNSHFNKTVRLTSHFILVFAIWNKLA